ncbi:GlxA family transcriptional regulator [Burkholderia gladioli]|uniref:GlxA family transcriptional regulator n=1 Tax=Burkholderia gladioli TaxID=28095 RepID=UPI000CFE474E|nr:GlxA family transcriptional regulator [Burkholderia gladioli]PRH35553.1 AraC family transcriptional regulator [Burkholderia gladioli]
MSASTPRHFGFLTLPSFSMIAFSSAIEALRMANYVDRSEHYRWTVYSVDGEAVAASNGMVARPTHRLDLDAPLPDLMIVCGGTQVREAVDAPVIHALRELARRGMPLGGICTGAYALMAAGLLDGYRGTVHWENLSALHAEFPAVSIVDELFVIDRDRVTCTGGTAPLDLMIGIVAAERGQELATRVSEQFVLQRIRGASDPQPIPVDARVGFSRGELVEAVRLMEANIEEPLPLADLARLIALSERQMQRMFKHYLSTSPTHYYLSVRLKHAREILRNSDVSIAQVTSLSGFRSACHFSKAYRAQFGHAPSQERRAPKTGTAKRARKAAGTRADDDDELEEAAVAGMPHA